MENQVPSQPILDECLDAGFATAGVAPARVSSHASDLDEWLASGRHGEMGWMEKNVEVRIDPRKLVPEARSIIVVADRYDGSPDKPLPPGSGRIARYARGRDYHTHMKKRLHRVADRLQSIHPGEIFRAFVDTAPILEREVAAAAALGAIGKHTLLIQPSIGSWLLLGEIVTTLAIQTTGKDTQTDLCGSCTRCIDACPTDAISPWSMDASRCVSYLTIEHRSHIDPSFHPAIEDWLFGCDICQEVCPHNHPTRLTQGAPTQEAYAPRPLGRDESGASFDVREVLEWTEDDRRKAFKTSSMKRAKLDMIRRNAVIVAGNYLRGTEDEALRSRLVQIAADESESPLVRQAAIDITGQR